MDLRSGSIILSCMVLMSTSGIYGWKFLKRGNYLLGLEWWAVTFSSTNLFIFLLTNASASYRIAHFMDAFSRGFGVPIIGVAGLMALTHGYRPTLKQDVMLFGISFLATFVLVGAEFVRDALPAFYLTMWALLSVYLAYFVRRLLVAGETFHAWTTGIALVTSLAIASIYDYYKIPGDDHNVVFNFITLALLTWAYFNVSLYYAYCALERRQSSRAVYPQPAY